MLFDKVWDKIWAYANRDTDKPDKTPIQPAVIRVTDAESARRLFRRYSGNSHAMEKECDKETLEMYRTFADSNAKEAWAEELCLELLEAIANGDTPRYVAFRTVNELMDYYLHNALAKPYTKAWFAVLDSEPAPVHVGCILNYLELYTKRFSEQQAADIVPLLDRTEAYLQEHVPEELKQSRYTSHAGYFREVCAEIRRIVQENTVTESKFSFVKTPPGTLDIIRDTLMAEYGDVDTVKEETANLNCAYGVQFGSFFLTGANDAADMASLRSWEVPECMAVFDRQAVRFRCVRKDDGSFGIDSCSMRTYPSVKEHEMLLTEAVCAYRNRPERKAFLGTLGHWVNYMADCQAQYLSQFPKVMRDVYKHIPDSSSGCIITDTLTLMVDYAEEAVGEYGSRSIHFALPAAKEEIADWEREKNVRLPKEYRQFLEFANGVSLPSAIEFFGLSDIDMYKKYLDQEGYTAYHHIGSFIGDGTTLCFSDEDGLFYEWQDGEMCLMGDFTDMVVWVCRL